MAVQIQYRRGTAAENAVFTGALGEITVDTTNGTIRVHDGSTPGGSNIATVAYVQSSTTSINNGSSNVTIPTADGPAQVHVNGSLSTTFVATGQNVVGTVYATGNVTADGNLRGSILTNLIDTLDGSSAISILPDVVISNVLTVTDTTETGNLEWTDTLTPTGVVSGNIVPSANVTYDLGNATNRWNDIYLAGNSIFLGAATISANATALTLLAPEGAEFTLAGDSTANTTVSAGFLSGNIITSLIDSSDSSAITVTPDMTLQASMSIQNDLTVDNRIDTAQLVAAGHIEAGTYVRAGNVNAGNVNADTHAFVGNVPGWASALDEDLSIHGVAAVETLAGAYDMAVVNRDAGNLTYAEFIAMNDVGNSTQGWISMGINSSTYDDPSFPITKRDGGYLLYEAPVGTTAGGNLVIGTGTNGANNYIVFGAGGFDTGNVQMLIMPDEQVHIEIPTLSTSTTTGALRVGGGMGLTGNLNMGGLLNVVGNITAGGTSIISGNNFRANNHVYSGPVLQWLSDKGETETGRRIVAVANIDGAAEVVATNTNAGNLSYGEFIAVNDVGNLSTGWISMGINSSTYDDPAYLITKRDDGYILYEPPAGTTASGNLVIGTGSEGTVNAIEFGAGGFATGNVQMTIIPDTQVHIEIPTLSTSTTTGALRVGGGMGLNGNLNMGGQLNVVGNITTGGTSTITANNLQANNRVWSGNVEGWLSDKGETDTGRRIAAVANIAGPAEVVAVNINSGNLSYGEFIAVNDVGNLSTGWISMGINSSTYDDPAYQITKQDDGYILYEPPAGTTASGNLVIGTGSEGTVNAIEFGAGGFATGNVQMTIIPDQNVHIEIPTQSVNTATGALTVVGGVGLQGNLNVGGDVNIVGNITLGGSGNTIDVSALVVDDPLIYVGANNAADLLDLGMVGQYFDGAANIYLGVVRDATDGVIKFFSNTANRPTTTVDFSDPNLVYNAIQTGAINVASATDSTGTTNGALIVAGGAGIAKEVYIGGNVVTTGNVSGANLNTAGRVSATGNVVGGNLTTGAQVVATGNITGGNLNTAGLIDATGNITGGNLVTAGQANVATVVASGNITATGNVSGGNVLATVNVIATANVVGGNLTTGAQVVATGNITGGNLITAGQANVATVVASGNISGGNLIASSQVIATGNVVGGNLTTGAQVVATGNITGGNLITAGVLSVNSGNISGAVILNAGGNLTGTIGSSSSWFGNAYVKAVNALYADLAECYEADATYDPGQVMIFGGNKEVTISTVSHDSRIAGVISTNPAYVMNAGMTDGATVALTGRVPCHVKGRIAKGDRLVSSDIPGVAQALDSARYEPGCIIGKALQDYDSDSVGTIEIAVGRL